MFLLMSIAQAAEYCGVSKSTWRTMKGPTPDAIVGGDEEGRGGSPAYTRDTLDRFMGKRPGRGRGALDNPLWFLDAVEYDRFSDVVKHLDPAVAAAAAKIAGEKQALKRERGYVSASPVPHPGS